MFASPLPSGKVQSSSWVLVQDVRTGWITLYTAYQIHHLYGVYRLKNNWPPLTMVWTCSGMYQITVLYKTQYQDEREREREGASQRTQICQWLWQQTKSWWSWQYELANRTGHVCMIDRWTTSTLQHRNNMDVSEVGRKPELGVCTTYWGLTTNPQ